LNWMELLLFLNRQKFYGKGRFNQKKSILIFIKSVLIVGSIVHDEPTMRIRINVWRRSGGLLSSAFVPVALKTCLQKMKIPIRLNHHGGYVDENT